VEPAVDDRARDEDPPIGGGSGRDRDRALASGLRPPLPSSGRGRAPKVMARYVPETEKMYSPPLSKTCVIVIPGSSPGVAQRR
jgi:hypothetical protein